MGLSVDMPVFDADSRVHHLARTKAELAREQAAYDSRVLQVRQEVWAAASELERAWDSIAANETSVRASEESLRVVRERYQTGAALITDLLDTQTALAERRGLAGRGPLELPDGPRRLRPRHRDGGQVALFQRRPWLRRRGQFRLRCPAGGGNASPSDAAVVRRP